MDLVSGSLSSFMLTFIDWLRYNKLTLNIDKTKVILFTTKTYIERPNICVDNVHFDCVNSHKYLGIVLDCKVNYNLYIAHIKSKLSMYVGISNKVSGLFNFSSAKNFYYSHIYSHINYCIAVWGGWLRLNKYESLSRKHIRII